MICTEHTERTQCTAQKQMSAGHGTGKGDGLYSALNKGKGKFSNFWVSGCGFIAQTEKGILQVKADVLFQSVHLLLGQGLIQRSSLTCLLQNSSCFGYGLAYKEKGLNPDLEAAPQRVLESKYFCPKSWHRLMREVQISLDTLHTFHREILLWEAEFLIQAPNREV